MDDAEKIIGIVSALLGLVTALISIFANDARNRSSSRSSYFVGSREQGRNSSSQKLPALVHQGKSYYLKSGENKIGSDSHNDIVIQDSRKSVSRDHATIISDHNGLSIVDHNSTNKTWINRKEIKARTRVRLKQNDRLNLGCWEASFRHVNSNQPGFSPSHAFGGGVTDDSMQHAGFWYRMGAFAIDIFIFNILFLITGSFIEDGYNTMLIFVLAWAYYALMESFGDGASIGKRMVRIRVVDMNQQPPSFLRAAARFLAKLLSLVTFGIGLIMIAFTRDKQALHDKVVDTLVIQR